MHVYDRVLPPSSYLRLQHLENDVNYIAGDIRDHEFLKLTLARLQIDTIFHVAAQPIVPISNEVPWETLSVNVAGTFSVLEAMRTSRHVQRLIFASSGAYYGATTTDQAIPEDAAPLDATNIYASSKVAGDIVARAYARIYGLKIATCRFMNTYGPGDLNFSRIVPRAIANLMNNKAYDFGSRDDGSSGLDFLFISDMADAYIKTAERLEEHSGDAFNFGSGQPTQIRKLTETLSHLFDGKHRNAIFSGPKKSKPAIKYLDTQKTNTLLDWSPSITLADGLQQTLDWYREHWSIIGKYAHDLSSQ
ncbi:putative NAD-dependent epimerase/dehydratase [Acidithiobacillus ferrivorans]|uniref:NAD-dependent epimerase/dehydratase n=1 Tax=Acidithiobacillus ferrivorans TaxID=160808 RepID=A0A060V0I2_9PROT|nr:putative sugar dehydratase/epimerase yfnG [Acidithiobacillus ferrivorans]SMH65074.1 putative NAD-dependent epimerase/dehydratase [Acidithiobacillus ferrivorans]